jgi:hypothetical protein
VAVQATANSFRRLYETHAEVRLFSFQAVGQIAARKTT